MFGGGNCNQNEQMVCICSHKVEIPSLSLKLPVCMLCPWNIKHFHPVPYAMQTSSEDTGLGSKGEFCLLEEEHYLDLEYL